MNKYYTLRLSAAALVLVLAAGDAAAQNSSRTADTTLTGGSRTGAIEPGRFFTLPQRQSTAAVSTVPGETLYKTAAANIANTLYGRLAGLTVTQASGEPGNDEALSGIRGIGSYGYLGGAGGYHTYKLFVDGFETNRNYFRNLSPAEIESIAILKDAAALATFGMRGSNGIIWVTTKRGRIGKPTIQVQARSGVQSPIKINKPLGAYEYASLYNQAISNDNGNVWTPRYSPAQLDAYRNGSGTNVDWYGQVLQSNALYADADLAFNGGDSSARYNVILNYANQQGLFNVDNTDSTFNQVFRRYNIRTNLDFRLFKMFEARVDLGGRIEQRKQPNYNIGQLWNDLARYPANTYPVKDPATGNWSGTTLFPNNPVASINELGWTSTNARFLQGNFELREKLDMITPGLYLSQAFSFNSFTLSGYNKTANYARYYEGAKTTTDQTTPIRATTQFPGGQEDWKQGTATIGYNRMSGNHQLRTAVNYHQSEFRGDGFYAFVYRYQNLSGRAHYMYKDKYIGELGFSYFGSDAYAPGNRWGFYPAISAGWIVSKEAFLEGSNTVSFLKLRASAGKTGNADTEGAGSPVGGQNGRYLYQQYYQQNFSTFYTGNGTPVGQGALTPLYIANPGVFAEQSMKYNAGVDVSLFHKLDLTIDVYLDKRSDILTRDNTIPGSFGNNVYISNLGKQTNKGFEVTGVYTDRAGQVGYSLTGLAAYNKNKIDYMAEVTPAYPYNAQTGRSYGTQIGLVSAGFYEQGDFNTDGSLKPGEPIPAFGTVQAGDLKYQDLNGDNKVDQNDVTEIGKPGYPQFTFAFGGSANYKGFDLDILFQGATGFATNILSSNNAQVQAFVNNGNAYAIAAGAWAYYPDQGIDTRAAATYPRLSTQANNNNYRASSFWIKKRDFLRIRNISLGYTLPAGSLRRIGASKVRFFVTAVNPVTWSKLLKEYNMDPETLSGYPALKSYNAGFTLVF
jgi:TonB-linked SusC/RagA family outer membrane protein